MYVKCTFLVTGHVPVPGMLLAALWDAPGLGVQEVLAAQL
jgi:hypothetical protein